MAAMKQLPEELIVEILLLLPVKSLLRFRCLSKSQCSVIDSPDFTNSHLSNSSQNLNLHKLVFSHRLANKFHVCDVNLDLEKDILHLEKPVSSSWNEIIGNCKGLLLLLHPTKFRFALWIPSTRQPRDLPDCPLEKPTNLSVSIINGSGLAYNDSVDDYKALIRVFVRGNIESEVQVWIYELKSNIWRRIQNFPYLAFEDFFPGIMSYFADGSLHWICTILPNRKEIVALDVGNETYSIVSRPVPINSAVPVYSRLHVLEGCLCICYFYDSTPSRTDLYIRKKNGFDTFTWTMLFSVTQPIHWFHNLKVLGYLKSGDKILLDIGMPYMVSYDLTVRSFGNIQVDKNASWESSIRCLENLVSMKRSS